MAHYAILNDSNVVTGVVVVNNDILLDGGGVEREQLGIDFLTGLFGAGNYVQTSFNDNIRKQYAGLNMTYDSVKDKFIDEQPYPSWFLDGFDNWQPPIPYPSEAPIFMAGADGKAYSWDEDAYQADNATGWIEVE